MLLRIDDVIAASKSKMTPGPPGGGGGGMGGMDGGYGGGMDMEQIRHKFKTTICRKLKTHSIDISDGQVNRKLNS